MLFVLTLLLLGSLEPPPTSHVGWLQDSIRHTQSSTEHESLLREAIENRYTVRRVEFTGNEFTRDNILRRRIFLQEGDVFTRRNLLRSIANVSKLKIIYPVRLYDVFVRLDRTDKLIDLTIRFRERRTRRTKRAS
jgi:hypothetical protein